MVNKCNVVHEMISKNVYYFKNLFCFVFNVVAAVTICSDFATLENKVSVSTVSPSICHEVMGLSRVAKSRTQLSD